MDLSEFGQYLSQQRELRGMSRDEVALATKIPLSVLGALEDGQAARLPNRVFVLHYIRAYAQVIGMAADEAVLRFEEIVRAVPELPPNVLEQVRKGRALRMLAAVLLGMLLALAVVGLLWAKNRSG